MICYNQPTTPTKSNVPRRINRSDLEVTKLIKQLKTIFVFLNKWYKKKTTLIKYKFKYFALLELDRTKQKTNCRKCCTPM